MPWVNPSSDKDMTEDEFDLYTDLKAEDLTDTPTHRDWVPAHVLIDHTTEEIEAMDEKDKKEGTYIGSSFTFDKDFRVNK